MERLYGLIKELPYSVQHAYMIELGTSHTSNYAKHKIKLTNILMNKHRLPSFRFFDHKKNWLNIA